MLQLYYSIDDEVTGNFQLPVLRSYWIQNENDIQAVEAPGALLDFKHAPEFHNGTPARSDRPDMRRTIIAGGLNSHNIDNIIKNFQPLGVDTARGVESIPGKKAKKKLELFIRKAKSWSYPID